MEVSKIKILIKSIIIISLLIVGTNATSHSNVTITAFDPIDKPNEDIFYISKFDTNKIITYSSNTQIHSIYQIGDDGSLIYIDDLPFKSSYNANFEFDSNYIYGSYAESSSNRSFVILDKDLNIVSRLTENLIITNLIVDNINYLVYFWSNNFFGLISIHDIENPELLFYEPINDYKIGEFPDISELMCVSPEALFMSYYTNEAHYISYFDISNYEAIRVLDEQEIPDYSSNLPVRAGGCMETDSNKYGLLTINDEILKYEIDEVNNEFSFDISIEDFASNNGLYVLDESVLLIGQEGIIVTDYNFDILTQESGSTNGDTVYIPTSSQSGLAVYLTSNEIKIFKIEGLPFTPPTENTSSSDDTSIFSIYLVMAIVTISIAKREFTNLREQRKY